MDATRVHDGRKPLRNLVAALVVAIAVVALGTMWWASQRALELRNVPTLTASRDGTAWVASHDLLHRFDADGRRTLRLEPAAIGLPLPLLHLHAVSADDLIVDAGEPSRVFRCDIAARACRAADAGYIERFGRFAGVVWIGADAAGAHVVLSDNAAHRVAVLDAQGRLLASAGGGIGRFHFPGQAVWVGERDIWLAGADHRRVEQFVFDGASLGDPVRQFELQREDALMDRRTWPMALAPLDDRAWWVIASRSNQGHSALIRLDAAAGRFDRVARLPAEADLTAVARLGNSLLVADLHGPAVHRVSLDGREVARFGDEAFYGEVRERQAVVEHAAQIQAAATDVMIGAPVVGVLLLLLLGEKVQLVAPRVTPPTGAPANLDRVLDVPLARRARYGFGAMFWLMILILPTIPVIALALEPYRAAAQWWMLMMLWACTFATMAAATWFAWCLKSQRLRAAADGVQLLYGNRVVAAAALSDCRTDGRTLFIGTRRVPLAPAFDADGVKRLLSHIPSAQWQSGAAFELTHLRELWHRHPWRTAMIWAAAVAAVALLLWLKSHEP